MTEPTTTPNPATEPTTPSGSGNGDKVTFTAEQQKVIDSLMGDRANRASASATADLLKQLGVDNVEAAKTRLAELETLKAAQLTETQRLQKEADDAKQEREQALAKAKERETKATQRLMDAALVAEMGTRFLPEARADILLYVHNTKELGDLLKVGDDDKVEGVKAVLDKVAESKKYLLAPTTDQRPPRGTPPGGGNRPPSLPPDADDARKAHAQEIRRW